jgi:hypothetical protein
MFKRLMGIGVALTILSGIVTAKALDWSEYSWTEGGVAILMPGEPEKSEQALANGGKLSSVAVSLGATYFIRFRSAGSTKACCRKVPQNSFSICLRMVLSRPRKARFAPNDRSRWVQRPGGNSSTTR